MGQSAISRSDQRSSCMHNCTYFCYICYQGRSEMLARNLKSVHGKLTGQILENLKTWKFKGELHKTYVTNKQTNKHVIIFTGWT